MSSRRFEMGGISGDRYRKNREGRVGLSQQARFILRDNGSVLSQNRLKAALRPLYRKLCRVCIDARFTPAQQAGRMKTAWDQRARENARHYIATGKSDWTDEEFFATGERAVADHILTDMSNICQGKPAESMRVLEIGCGAGRITKALARTFGEVHGVDVSGEMVRRARGALLEYPNVHLYENNGMDLTVIPYLTFDFAFSYLVFQHIPSYPVIESYVRETHRLLAPGGLFKFQVRGNTADESKGTDTWVGFAFSDERARSMARDCGFEARFQAGAGSQDFWLWFFKPR